MNFVQVKVGYLSAYMNFGDYGSYNDKKGAMKSILEIFSKSFTHHTCIALYCHLVLWKIRKLILHPLSSVISVMLYFFY